MARSTASYNNSSPASNNPTSSLSPVRNVNVANLQPRTPTSDSESDCTSSARSSPIPRDFSSSDLHHLVSPADSPDDTGDDAGALVSVDDDSADCASMPSRDWSHLDLDSLNAKLECMTSEQIVQWALLQSHNAVVSTNFRPYGIVLVHMATSKRPTLPVIWADHGYNVPETYVYAEQMKKELNLNLKHFIPKRTVAHRTAMNGGVAIPERGTPEWDSWVAEVKLEPFQRALSSTNAEIWLTGVRRDQTATRAQMKPLSIVNGILKVCPLLKWNTRQLFQYTKKNKLSVEFEYNDPTKPGEHEECGLHTTFNKK